jgi:hypothetical protein
MRIHIFLRQGEEYGVLIDRCYKACRIIQTNTVVNAVWNGLPVFLTGKTVLRSEGVNLIDKATGFDPGFPTIRIKRTVEVYQWEESKKEKHTTYTQVWAEADLNSIGYKDRHHHNPPRHPSIYSKCWNVESDVLVGKFELSKEQVEMMDRWDLVRKLPRDLDFNVESADRKHISDEAGYDDAVPCMRQSVTEPCEYFVKNGNLANPVIGTMRISYEFIPLGRDVSLVGVQEDEGTRCTFRPFDSDDAHREVSIKKMAKHRPIKKEGRSWQVELIFSILIMAGFIDHKLDDSVLFVEERLTDKEEIFRDARNKQYKKMVMIRLMSCLLLGFGFYFILDPITFILWWFPFLQSLVQNLFFLVAMILGFVFGSLIISLAWIEYHPEYCTTILVLLGWYFISANYTVGMITFGLALYPLYLSVNNFIDEWKYNAAVEQDKRDELAPLLKEFELKPAHRSTKSAKSSYLSV